MRIMITGGTGFIGSALASGLVRDGHHVVAYDLTPQMERIADIRDALEIVRGDIRDPAKLIDAIKTHRIDHIMHLAAYLPEAAIREQPTLAIRINAEGTNNVFEAARIMGVRRVVYASSESVDPTGPTEDAPCQPMSLYGHLKLLNEAMARHYTDRFGLDTIGLRFGMNYGPGSRLIANELERQYASAIVHDAIEKVARDEQVLVLFDESASFHWVYIRDNVRLMTLSLQAPDTENRVFNVCGDQLRTLGDMADILRRIRPGADVAFRGSAMSSALRPSEAHQVDCSAARKQLGYAPEYSLERGLREYIATYATQ